MNQLRMSRGRTGKISASLGGTEKIVWNRYPYQFPAMVGTNASTKQKYKFYSSTVQAISRGVVDCTTKVGALCDHSFYIGYPVKTQVGNGLSMLFNLRGQTIDTSDQSVLTLNDSGIFDEEGNKINTSDPLTAAQRQSGHFCLSLWRFTYTRLTQTASTAAWLQGMFSNPDKCRWDHWYLNAENPSWYSSPLGDFGKRKKERYCHTQEGERRYLFRILHRELQIVIPVICK